MPYSEAKQRAWREANRDYARDFNLKRNYGISLAEFEVMAARQRGKCAICGRVPAGKANQACLHVDHDHRTSKIRGLLCSNCNRGLGFFGDDIITMRRAASYLRDGG